MILEELKKMKETGDPEAFKNEDNIRMINYEVGSNLRNEIALRGLKVNDIAVSLDMSPGNLEKIFKGHVKLDTTKYFTLMVLHGFNPLDVMMGRNNVEYLSEFTGQYNNDYVIMDYAVSDFDRILIEVNKLDQEKQFKVYGQMLMKVLEARRIKL